MSTTHDQAMHHVYQQVLQRLHEHMTQAQRASVQLLMQRLLVAAGGQEYIGGLHLMLPLGSDRRNAYLLTCLRAAQLNIARRHRESFRLTVLVVRQPTLDGETLANHQRAFDALCMHTDPRVTLLRVDCGQAGAFGARPACSQAQQVEARNAWLLFGHLAGAEPEALIGARAYLELATGLGLAVAADTSIDALVSVAPLVQRRRLLAWGRRCLRHTLEIAQAVPVNCARSLVEGLGQVSAVLADPLPEPRPQAQRQGALALRVLAVDDLLAHVDDGPSLEAMLGRERVQPCHAQGPAGVFDPLPLAHLHGLKAQHIDQCGYRQGAQRFLKGLGRRQVDWPQGQALRREAEARLLDAYGVSDAQLTCLLYSPFEASGRNLEHFVACCYPGMRVALPYLHRALQGRPCPEPVLRWLIEISGLELAQLRAIYAGRFRPEARRLFLLLAQRDRWLRPLLDTPVAADAALQANR
ncbi:hypothetical protein [Pantoea sp. Cy-639]|uniref:hypothetical protein n=1 Tax=Pantoea sp. Cy-639 TaxID=2608360 RepID=UPI0014211AE2|nr:hypothetical protein [Pantoea sp. Cy-639]NIF17721.1 hypothetical protein [Pantoea sp. Cy-639]